MIVSKRFACQRRRRMKMPSPRVYENASNKTRRRDDIKGHREKGERQLPHAAAMAKQNERETRKEGHRHLHQEERRF